ncbi:hypothetical protein ACQ86N_10130 [Puia sp. P3]|uniref:hypothetical protein n=1 Tax=Puia sp. P3 TaxID=3423952 RepID=UPI003D674BE3
MLKRFSIRDGMGVERLRKLAGIETGIITGELSPSVARRAEKLHISELHLGVKDKAGQTYGNHGAAGDRLGGDRVYRGRRE